MFFLNWRSAMSVHRISAKWFGRGRFSREGPVARSAERLPAAPSRRGPRTVPFHRAVGSALEPLEARRLFSVTAAFAGGVLTVTGDNNANAITVSRDAAGPLLVNSGAVAIGGGGGGGATAIV